MGKRALLIFVGIIVAAVAITVAAASTKGPIQRQPTPTQHPTATTGTTGTTADLDGHGTVVTTDMFRNIAKKENPVVVAITTESRVKNQDMGQMFGGDQGGQDFLRRFFGMQMPQQQPREQIENALGSGFIVTADGEILTNNHVVAGAQQIRVALFGNDQKTYPAKVIGRDQLTDSALIKLENGPANLPIATLGNSDAVEPGDWVMAIGNPFTLGHTVTVGVISFKGRPMGVANGRWENMLQTDASINPGNSGGPLLDTDGNVIGINSAILSSGGGGGAEGGNIGIGFAVPINTVKTLLPQLRQGTVKRGQLGVQILSTPMTDDEAKSLGLPKPEGAVVSSVESGSPAEHAGLRPGDVIVEYNGQAVQDADHLTQMVVSTAAGTRVQITFYRDGQRQTATATIQALNLEGTEQQNGGGGAAEGFGLSLGDVTPDIAQQLNLPSNVQGAVVENVEPGSAAAAAVQRGDVILQVNHQPVHSSADASHALASVQSGQPAFLLLWRQGSRVFVEVRKQ